MAIRTVFIDPLARTLIVRGTDGFDVRMTFEDLAKINGSVAKMVKDTGDMGFVPPPVAS